MYPGVDVLLIDKIQLLVCKNLVTVEVSKRHFSGRTPTVVPLGERYASHKWQKCKHCAGRRQGSFCRDRSTMNVKNEIRVLNCPCSQELILPCHTVCKNMGNARSSRTKVFVQPPKDGIETASEANKRCVDNRDASHLQVCCLPNQVVFR